MAVSMSNAPPIHLHRNLISLHFPPSVLYSPPRRSPLFHPRLHALKTESDSGSVRSQDAYNPDLLRKPTISPIDDGDVLSKKGGMSGLSDDNEGLEDEGKKIYRQREDEEWVDWEDQILEDTVPLVGFVRMILHSGKYGSGDRLSPEHEKTILDRLLPYHPQYEKKIGCGINYITVGYHPDFEGSRCLFIVRKDGELVDFSYWKCIKGLIKKNYPLYADSFILRHFRQRRRRE
ncbi:PREDICTED: protein DCL, chloroplastic [Nelumbo nucifera]|uniref:Protein DCL, chloroplastic n=1 Tax=Nelumbo nucifera TaxID=4432 RepID=A0A1U8ADH0_NELNU|nr:PREDICTED: protein DCL, chloroplastic [Nelumbo nucifera]